ncbi:MAG: DUF1566 domain-containing protein [Candidatus Electrothrix sp. AUS1_2]|nr:DUF1566 domain-containing protein [Candidatus Electrothrix sp. AUS1_2]
MRAEDMRKIILLAGLVAGGVALSVTAYANNWLLYLPAILAGSGGGTEPPVEESSGKWLLFLPAILAGSQKGTTKPVAVTGALNDTGIVTTAGSTGAEDADHGRDSDSATNSDADGHAGFSFTKLAADGSELDASAESWYCVQDNVTGLVWSPDQGGGLSWAGAGELVNNANTAQLCGKTDWRLPEVGELLGIISYDADSYTTGKTVDTTYFGDTQAGAASDTLVWYWTATAVDDNNQWGVTFQPKYTLTNGTEVKSVSLSNTLSTDALNKHPVRLVSGTVKESNFTSLEDGSTVQDNNTGLIWKRCLEGQTFSSGSCTGTETKKTWAEALALDDGTWRVPNLKELRSIVGKETYFPTPATNLYVWSSSPYAVNTLNSWVVDFKSGLLWNSISQNTTDPSVYVRLVRDAPTE